MRILFLAGAGMGNLILATPAFNYLESYEIELYIDPGLIPDEVLHLFPYQFVRNSHLQIGTYDHVLVSHFYDGPKELKHVQCKSIISLPYHHSVPEYMHYLQLAYLTIKQPYSLTPEFTVLHTPSVVDGNLVTLCPTATRGQPIKRWPYWVSLAAHLIQNSYRVQVIGTPDDIKIAEATGGPFHEMAEVRTDLTLPEVADTIASSAITVANDCGLAHISHATHTPTLVLSGPVPPTKSLPPGVNFLYTHACPYQPCYREFKDWNVSHQAGRCKQECLYAINPELVYNEIVDIITTHI